VTFYTVFVIDLATQRVRVLGTTPHPDEAFMQQVVRTLTMADANHCRLLICDRDAKWSAAVRQRLEEAGIRVVLTKAHTNSHTLTVVRRDRLGGLLHEYRRAA